MTTSHHTEEEPAEIVAPVWWAPAPQLPALIDEDAQIVDASDEEEASGDMVALTRAMGRRAEGNAVLRKEIGRRLVTARCINGFDQTEGAARLGYRNSTQLSLAEQGKRLPPHEILIRASVAYGVSMDFLFGLSDEPERDPKAAVRHAAMRRVELLLRQNTMAVAETLIESTRSNVADAMQVAGFLSCAAEACDAIASFVGIHRRWFADARGGARLVRTGTELEEAVSQVRRFVERSERLHADAMARARARSVADAQLQPSTAEQSEAAE